MRIKFVKQNDVLISVKIYATEDRMARLIIDPNNMTYSVVDPTTGFAFSTGGGVKNLEVLHRKAKKALKAYLNVTFTKEKRNVKPK